MDLFVGATCAWYPHGDVNQHPSVGIVTAIKRPGILTIYRLPASGGMPRMIDNVHHVESERLAENQNLRLEYGGWDTVEAAETRRQVALGNLTPVVQAVLPPVDAAQSCAETEMGEDQKKILSYYEEGMTVEKIAEKMGRGWGPKKVSNILKSVVQPTA